MATFSCDHCGHSKTVNETYVGKRVKCPRCGKSSTVEVESTPELISEGQTPKTPDTTLTDFDFLDDKQTAWSQESPVERGAEDCQQTLNADSTVDRERISREKSPQGLFIILGSAIQFTIAVMLASFIFMTTRRGSWEYKTVDVMAELGSLAFQDNDKALTYKTIPDQQELFNELGDQGWELVSTFLEHETAHPNFGKEDYVTGLQPNTRPQKLVCIFKRSR